MRHRFGYFTPDDVYEAVVDSLVAEGSSWVDVGCGRDLLPGNRPLAKALAARCALLVGVDPDPTIEENPFVHRRIRVPIEEFRDDRLYDLVTLRMVAEHIQHPERAAEALARLTGPGARVVLYTVDRWSPAALTARVLPFGLHHPIKHLLWGTEEKDTFPVAYKMNSRRQLSRLMGAHGFVERWFARVDDCRSTGRFRALQWLELSLWRALRATGLGYPEGCLLGVYERAAAVRELGG
ncbi:MAG TPA: methyltransferase domain-containing protein [Isosphaeraceae bacterium]|jgi:SAM-dependent methyltransferase